LERERESFVALFWKVQGIWTDVVGGGRGSAEIRKADSIQLQGVVTLTSFLPPPTSTHPLKVP
jgi:hypothetical protein